MDMDSQTRCALFINSLFLHSKWDIPSVVSTVSDILVNTELRGNAAICCMGLFDMLKGECSFRKI
jgi:hypothetical protein